MKARIVLMAALTALALAGCSLLLGGGGETATLVVSFSPELTARTIEPELSMEVHHYEVSGTGPRGASFLADDVAPGDAVVESSLLPGEWTITVEAFNAPTADFPDGKLIGRGVATVTIVSGEVLALTITVTPIDDVPGTLDIGISWPAGVLTSEELSATLVPSGVTPDPSVHEIEFLPEDVSPRVGSRYTNTALDPGYYLFSVQLLDFGTTPVWGTVEAVRIVAGEPSEKDYELVEDVNRGGLDLAIEPDLQNPIEITFDLPDEGTVVAAGNTLTVEATTSEPVDTYAWYLNGALQSGSSGPTFEIPATLVPAYYRLDLVVGTTDGVLSSDGLQFQVVSVGSVSGPTFTPPGAGTLAQTGSIIGVTGGVTFDWTAFDLDATALLLWTPDAGNPPGLAFDGAIDESGESLVFDAATSDPSNGILRFVGEAEIRYYQLPGSTVVTQLLPTRLTVTVTDASAAALVLNDPVPFGLPAGGGGVLQVAGDFSVNVLLESFYEGAWEPSIDLFDRLPTLAEDGGGVRSTFTGVFYFVL